ncbi:hypothetical protein ACQ4PT_046522 [Festuca glaucescens]
MSFANGFRNSEPAHTAGARRPKLFALKSQPRISRVSGPFSPVPPPPPPTRREPSSTSAMASRSSLIALCESFAARARIVDSQSAIPAGLGSRLSLVAALGPDLAVAPPPTVLCTDLCSLAPLLQAGKPLQVGSSPLEHDVIRAMRGVSVHVGAAMPFMQPVNTSSSAGSNDGFNQAEFRRWACWISRNFAIDLSASDVNQMYAVLSVCTEVFSAADFMELLFSKFPNDGPDCGPLALNVNRCADKPVAGNAGGNPGPEEDKNPQDESSAVKERTASGFLDVLSLNLDGIVVKNPAFLSPWCDKSLSSKKAAPSSSNDWPIGASFEEKHFDDKVSPKEGSSSLNTQVGATFSGEKHFDDKASPKEGASSLNTKVVSNSCDDKDPNVKASPKEGTASSQNRQGKAGGDATPEPVRKAAGEAMNCLIATYVLVC